MQLYKIVCFCSPNYSSRKGPPNHRGDFGMCFRYQKCNYARQDCLGWVDTLGLIVLYTTVLQHAQLDIAIPHSHQFSNHELKEFDVLADDTPSNVTEPREELFASLGVNKVHLGQLVGVAVLFAIGRIVRPEVEFVDHDLKAVSERFVD